ncbi:MAG TPA: HD-GYP domain-containing protein [Terracidiphilus sp.]|nr:HD-GYP domain-containing protein [Terracidiphilus sp.]
MRFRTRAFLLCFVPFAVLFAATFWVAQKLVQSTVRSGLLASLRESQLALARAQAKADLQNGRFLQIEAESTELQSGMQLLLTDPSADDARKAMEDQLRALGDRMGFDLLFVSEPDGAPLAGVMRQASAKGDQKGQLVPLGNLLVAQPATGLLVIGDRIFQFASAPIGEAGANIGTLSVGEYFKLPQSGKLAVLIHDGDVIDFNLSNVLGPELDEAMKDCAGRQECDFRLEGANWLAMPMQDLGGGYLLWSLENVDEATRPIRTRLRSFFLIMQLGLLLIALLCSIVSSRSIEKPIAVVISQLRNAEQTGVLPEALPILSSTAEMRELATSYTRAAVSARNARERLQSAYVEFIGSLANALDARDRYTSGHSKRVSRFSSATAAAMGLDRECVERIRIGAQLHDIGKIGVPDSALQKPGLLTAEEFALVKEHPVIGRRILEGVAGLAPYLDAVELHHENWDGSGYPRRQSGLETPIDARIIHVSDAYDAMTSQRSYRRTKTHEQAIQELIRCAGTQFDPRVVEVFAKLPRETFSAQNPDSGESGTMRQLEAAEAD